MTINSHFTKAHSTCNVIEVFTPSLTTVTCRKVLANVQITQSKHSHHWLWWEWVLGRVGVSWEDRNYKLEGSSNKFKVGTIDIRISCA